MIGVYLSPYMQTLEEDKEVNKTACIKQKIGNLEKRSDKSRLQYHCMSVKSEGSGYVRKTQNI